MTLPGLDTANITWIAYWNFLDNGAVDITPSDAISAMETFQEYDNGVDGTIILPRANISDRLINCRVKDDGWIIVWIDRTEVYARSDNNEEPYAGPYDVVNSCFNPGRNIRTTKNNLERTVKKLFDAFSNSNLATYNPGDVGLYSYWWEEADTITIVGEGGSGFGGGYTIEPVAGTNIVDWAFGCSVSTSQFDRISAMEWNGTNIASDNSNGTSDPISEFGAQAGESFEINHDPLDNGQYSAADIIGWY